MDGSTRLRYVQCVVSAKSDEHASNHKSCLRVSIHTYLHEHGRIGESYVSAENENTHHIDATDDLDETMDTGWR